MLPFITVTVTASSYIQPTLNLKLIHTAAAAAAVEYFQIYMEKRKAERKKESKHEKERYPKMTRDNATDKTKDFTAPWYVFTPREIRGTRNQRMKKIQGHGEE